MKLLRSIRRTILRVFPPARPDLRFSDAIPLIGFVLVFATILWRLISPATVEPIRWTVYLIGLAYGGVLFFRGRTQRPTFREFVGAFVQLLFWTGLMFLDVWLAWLGRPVGSMVLTQPWRMLWLLVVVWVWWMSVHGWSGLDRRRARQSLIVRMCLVGIFTILMAEPRAVRTSDSLSVIYAIDMSASIHPEQVNESLKFVSRTVSQKPEGDQAGLIIFGSQASVELPPAQSFPLDENSPEGTIYLNSRIDRDATNLSQALSLGSAILPEDSRGRVVLISDGSETAGDLQPILEQLRSRGVAVDVLPVTYNYDREVWVERLELPQTVKIGEPYAATVIVSALNAGKGRLILEENGEPIREEPFEVEFQEGKNRFDIPIYLREPGYYEYRATLLPEDGTDGRSENNQAISYIFVEGEGRVLVVRDPFSADARDYELLVEAIRQEGRAVDVVDSLSGFPRDALSLLTYDAVIFANVPQDAFDLTQLDAMREAVYNQGTGFLMIGGENSFGPGGYHRTPIEEILPVTMDITNKKIIPKGALAIILHTCEFPEGNTWAKRISKQAIRVLGTQDLVGLIAYEVSGEDWIFKMTPAGDYDSLVPMINAAQIGDMPAFGPAMQIGYDGLMATDAATRHMIIISDGDPSPPSPVLLQNFVSNAISISTIAVFPHGGQEVGLLRSIANATGGRYYFPDDPNKLPSIFIKEAKTLKRSMIQEKEIQPQVGFPSPILEGIDGLPPLHGFVLTSLKENALTEDVLYTELEDGDQTETDPVLAVWRYGLGTTAAFTSSLSNQWARDWVSWEDYRAFVKQLLTRISRVRRAGHLRVWSSPADGEGLITVEDFHPDEMFLDVTARVVGPGGIESTVPLKQVGPRRYQGTFPAEEKGRYQVTVTGQSGEREDRAFSGFIISYSPEFLKFTSNWDNLRRIKELTGGEELTAESKAEDIYNRRVPKQSSRPIFDWFLLLIAFLIPADVAIRRVQIDWATVRQKLGFGRKADTTQTMGALLARKKQVGDQLGPRDGEPTRPKSTHVPKRPPAGPPKRQPSQPGTTTQSKPPSSTAIEEPSESTTSRLLKAKRQRNDGGTPEDS